MTDEIVAKLCCHGATPSNDIRAVYVNVRRSTEELDLRFRLEADISRVRLTRPHEPQGRVELWRHTCFEVFVAIRGKAAYHEFNFAPWHEWQLYAFRGYRDLISTVNGLRSPIIAISSTNALLKLDARVTLTDLSAIHTHSTLLLGLSAIIEPKIGPLTYWAVRHANGKPDFHHKHTFALRLEPPEPARRANRNTVLTRTAT